MKQRPTQDERYGKTDGKRLTKARDLQLAAKRLTKARQLTEG